MTHIKIKNRLYYYRQLKSLSQKELAEKVGVTKDTISRIERESTQIPRPNTRRKIAQILDVEVHKVFRPIKIRP